LEGQGRDFDVEATNCRVRSETSPTERLGQPPFSYLGRGRDYLDPIGPNPAGVDL
jgi:hypothetical protein